MTTPGQALADALGIPADHCSRIIIEPAGGGQLLVLAELQQFDDDGTIATTLRRFTITATPPADTDPA